MVEVEINGWMHFIFILLMYKGWHTDVEEVSFLHIFLLYNLMYGIRYAFFNFSLVSYCFMYYLVFKFIKIYFNFKT